MVDLTARIDALSDRHRTHVDLYYAGSRLADSTLITPCVLLDVSNSPDRVDLEALGELSRVVRGGSVILKTGWEHHRGTPQYDASPWIDRRLIERLVFLGVTLVLVDSPGVFGEIGRASWRERV